MRLRPLEVFQVISLMQKDPIFAAPNFDTQFAPKELPSSDNINSADFHLTQGPRNALDCIEITAWQSGNLFCTEIPSERNLITHTIKVPIQKRAELKVDLALDEFQLCTGSSRNMANPILCRFGRFRPIFCHFLQSLQ